MNEYHVEIRKTVGRPWINKEPIRLGDVPKGLGTPDHYCTVSRDEEPYLLLCLYGSESYFAEARIWQQWLVVGFGCFISFLSLEMLQRQIIVGDCQCLLNQELVLNEKKIDTITANARSMFLEAEIAQGKTIEELLQHDSGRAFILPLLERQMLFQNNPAAGQYWFSIIDGFEVADEGIRIHPFPADIQTIVLASDGYPFLKETLAASEIALQEILHDDPLLFREYKTTKGMNGGNVSFDDRAYVKLSLREETVSYVES